MSELGFGSGILGSGFVLRMSASLSNKLTNTGFIIYYNTMITQYITTRVSALIFSVKIAGSCVSCLLWIHFSFDVNVDWVFCFFVTVFWMQILLSPMLCIVIAHKVLTWGLGFSVLNALLICKSMCEEDEVKGEMKLGQTVLLTYYNLVWKSRLRQLAQPRKGPKCLGLQLGWRWLRHPS